MTVANMDKFKGVESRRMKNKREFEDFMNDRGEMRLMPSRIVTTKILRNKRLERRVIEENRERMLYYVILMGAVLLLFGIM